MVYKKIGDKIPSLSSLLLAGVLLGSKCPDAKETDAQAEQPKDTAADALKKSEKNDGDEKPIPLLRDPELSESSQKMRKYLISVAGLDHLGKRSPSLLLDKDFESTARDDLKTRVKDFIQRFSNTDADAYSKDLNPYFCALATVTKDQIKHPYAWGWAMNEIAKTYNELHDIYREVVNLSTNGASMEAFKDLNDRKSAPFLERLTSLTSGSPFPDNKSNVASLLTGPQLARFMTDLDENGREKGSGSGNKYRVQSEIFSPAYNVWVKHKLELELTPAQQSSRGLSNLSRGEEVIREWKVAGGKDTTMPEIPPLNNKGVTYNFDLLKAIPAPAPATPALQSTPDQCFSLEAGNTLSANENAAKLSQVTLGTLLFTLFRGSKPLDFLEISKNTDANDSVQFIGKNDAFQQWVKIDNNQAFAQMLAGHIQSDHTLSELFFIPNEEEILAKISCPSKLGEGSSEVPAVGADTATASGDLLTLRSGSPLYKVCRAIYGALGLTYDIQDRDLFKGLEFLKAIGGAGKYDQSSVTLQQRIYIHLATKLYDLKPDFVRSVQPPSDSNNTPPPRIISERELYDKIVRFVREITRGAVVVRNGDGEYEATEVSRQLKLAISNLNNKLIQKSKRASITYDTIKSIVAGNQSQATGGRQYTFDIREVTSVIEKEFVKLKELLLSDVPGALSSSAEGVPSGTFFRMPWLSEFDYQALTKIKKEYKEKKKQATRAPGA